MNLKFKNQKKKNLTGKQMRAQKYALKRTLVLLLKSAMKGNQTAEKRLYELVTGSSLAKREFYFLLKNPPLNLKTLVNSWTSLVRTQSQTAANSSKNLPGKKRPRCSSQPLVFGRGSTSIPIRRNRDVAAPMERCKFCDSAAIPGDDVCFNCSPN